MKIIKYSAVLIGVYLGVAYATGLGQDIKAGSVGASKFAKTLQGR